MTRDGLSETHVPRRERARQLYPRKWYVYMWEVPMIIPKIGLVGAVTIFTLGAATLPNPSADENRAEKKTETVVLAGGCFWGIQGVFDADRKSTRLNSSH